MVPIMALARNAALNSTSQLIIRMRVFFFSRKISHNFVISTIQSITILCQHKSETLELVTSLYFSLYLSMVYRKCLIQNLKKGVLNWTYPRKRGIWNVRNLINAAALKRINTLLLTRTKLYSISFSGVQRLSN